MATRTREKGAARAENRDKRPQAHAKNIRLSPSKAKIVLDLIRGKDADKALEILRSRLLAQKQKEQQDAINAQRQGQVGTGDRSEKIRTYNFPQDRCTDHRIGLTVHNLEKIMDGNLDEVIDALATREQTEKLQKLGG